jgi:cell wall-associated NlpC family hydrolase
MKRLLIILLFISASISNLFGFSDSLKHIDSTIEFDYTSPEMKRLCMIDSIIDFAYTFIGTPYRYAGKTTQGFDCSGFVNYIHLYFGMELGSSSREISELGDKITFDSLQVGDLVFFKGRKLTSTAVGHVGMVIEKTPTSFKMIHSSTSKGVRIDDYSSIYYKTRYLFGKRVL